jgi:hypothetical protein
MIKLVVAMSLVLLLTYDYYACFLIKPVVKTRSCFSLLVGLFSRVAKMFSANTHSSKILTISFFCLSFIQFSHAQPKLNSLVKHYYKVNPFKGTFAAFLNFLSQDQALLNKQEHKKNDSAGYYLRGKYEMFNPFKTQASSVDMLFYEDWKNDFNIPNDRYYNYQITAYFPDTDFNRKNIIKEYNTLVHKIKQAYPEAHGELLNGQKGVNQGEIQAFRNVDAPLTTAMASWQTLDKTKQLGLSLILRLKKDNLRLVPLTPAAR